MSKIATNFVNQYNLTPQMNVAKRSSYAEELVKKLKNSKARVVTTRGSYDDIMQKCYSFQFTP